MKLKTLIELLSLEYDATGETEDRLQARTSLLNGEGAPIIEGAFLDRGHCPGNFYNQYAKLKDAKILGVYVGTDLNDKAQISIYLDV